MMIVKRILDFTAAIAGLLILTPVFLIVALLIRLKLGSPIFFYQMRAGKGGKPFQMVKFRTMLEAYNENGEILPDYKRMTSFGSFLRSSSLDELPELWNVIKGDMSLVGPRPLLLEYLPLYTDEQARRHEVLPGVTGWAQINGRNAIGWDEKLKLDIWYVDNKSFQLDLKIILITINKVLRREGITAKEQVTMSKFTGEEK